MKEMEQDKQDKQKPIWNKKQVAKVKRYLKSKECADDFKKMNAKWEEEDRQQRLDDIAWWQRIKDIPFNI
ncbi:MAG TPA: hypothetical protein VN026_11500 [Bacteroidia bacterium]|jgi:hypothetical protein|nr:hypothetical protein [Bacteroidia bacterium]